MQTPRERKIQIFHTFNTFTVWKYVTTFNAAIPETVDYNSVEIPGRLLSIQNTAEMRAEFHVVRDAVRLGRFGRANVLHIEVRTSPSFRVLSWGSRSEIYQCYSMLDSSNCKAKVKRTWHAERVNCYRKGGSRPVNIGDTFNDRYCVVKKLGFGAGSTIWLVKDLTSHRFVSLKVISAKISSGSSEMYISQYLMLQQEQKTSHPGREHIIRIFDTFVIQGPNGTHHCIVTEFLGISLVDDVDDFYGYRKDHFPSGVTRKVAVQVSLGVAYLHSCGVVHGDLHLGNVLFYSPHLQTAPREELDRIYGQPYQRPFRYDKDDSLAPPTIHIPRSLVAVCNGLPLLERHPHPDIDKPFHSNMPRVFAAPEVIFNDISSPTFSMDIWALGVPLYMIINEKWPPFNSDRGVEKEVVERMILRLGKLPDKWWTRWADRAEYFDDNGAHVCEKSRGAAEKLEPFAENLNGKENGSGIKGGNDLKGIVILK
ncbi:kinase-like domain-containing protein [Cyathus striatus]|nr:kinase-like domain-containing protein [Cyathus striatus]